MPAHDTYMLHVYRSRAVNGWQWAARVDDLPGRASRRFTNPEALLAYLRIVAPAGEPSVAPHPPSGVAGPATTAEDGATNGGG